MDAPGLVLQGLVSHSGHAYSARGAAEAAAVAEEERTSMLQASAQLSKHGILTNILSVGSTPALCAAGTLEGIHEARPGNYCYFDRAQTIIGSCSVADCALTVHTSVVGTYSKHAIIDAGALSLSKDAGPSDAPLSMGEVYASYADKTLHESLRVTSVSQEHGLLSEPRPIGTTLRILPNHSCLTSACFDHLWVVSGSEVLDRWRVWRGR